MSTCFAAAFAYFTAPLKEFHVHLLLFSIRFTAATTNTNCVWCSAASWDERAQDTYMEKRGQREDYIAS
jgi:hypothetical protein